MDKSEQADMNVKEKGKRTWPLWKKLLIVAVAIVVIGLAVGLGVGLTVGRGGDGDDNEGGNEGGNGGGETGPKPNLTQVWQPEVEASWQIILVRPIDLQNKADIDPDVQIFDLDLYDNQASTFKTLHDGGKKVICYFSAGSWENWRGDAKDFDKADLGKPLKGWEGEKWLNVSSPNVQDIMKKRIQLAHEKGCDAIDPDNVDGYQNKNGLDLTKQDSINFMKFLSNEAARYNMSTGLKNAGDIIGDVLDWVAFSVNEQCIQYSECETFAPFIKAKKPVFNIEYPDDAPQVKTAKKDEICSDKGNAQGTSGFSKVIKKMKLDGWVEYCDGKSYTTKLNETS